MKNKRGNILTENVIFIILNLVFFASMVGFLYIQSSDVHLVEEVTAKKIALLIDASKPGTDLVVDLSYFSDETKDYGGRIEIDKVRKVVSVKGAEDSFFEYGYFNDVVVADSFENGILTLKIKGAANNE